MCEELIKKEYERRKAEIKTEFEEFRRRGLESSDEELFVDLCHCICSPKTNFDDVKNAITELRGDDLLFLGDAELIVKPLKRHRIRFHSKKAQHIVECRSKFFGQDAAINLNKFAGVLRGMDSRERRELLWMAMRGCGLGWKEISESLRNLGLGSDYAILDSWILGWLHRCGKIEEIPKDLLKSKYLEIEEKMRKWAQEMNMPLDELDLLLWRLDKP